MIPSRALEAVGILGILVIFIYTFYTNENNDSVFKFVTLFAAASSRVLPSLNRCLAAVMGITATVITTRQNTALTRQATDYGASMARFIAKLSAVSALAEDWVAVEVAIQAMMKEGDVQSITVIDRAGVVRAASAGPTGKPYEPPKGKALDSLPGEVGVVRYTIGKEPVLGFEAPITFQDKGVGRVALGVPERPLLAVIRLSITLMVILVLVTVAAVAIAMYFLADRFARPVRLVIESMQEIGKGRFDHRIKEHRNDEFGQLYAGFDEMAEALGARQQAPAVAENTAHKA